MSRHVDQILAALGKVERSEIKSLITQLEANGARIVDDDVRMLLNATDQERYSFLLIYQRN